MAKYSSKDLSITVGGTDMSQHTRSIGGMKISKLLQESTSFGDAWFEALSTGIGKMDDLQIGGFWDDAAGGPKAKYGVAQTGTTVAVVITLGSTNTISFSAIIQDYEARPAVNQVHEYMVTLKPTGTITEA